MTKQKWIVLAAVATIIFALVGLGFAAMSTNPPFIVPTWVPILFFILAGLATFALVAYLMWELIIRIPLRFQTPIKNITNLVPVTMTTAKQPVPRRLEHDGVLWEDGGYNALGGLKVEGPLCPKDYTPLAIRHLDTLANRASDNMYISDYGYSRLVCPECKTEYTLGKNQKKVGDSRNEVRSRFEGKRRRD